MIALTRNRGPDPKLFGCHRLLDEMKGHRKKGVKFNHKKSKKNKKTKIEPSQKNHRGGAHL